MFDRRAFLGGSLAALAMPALAASEKPFSPDTLFLTWQRDPCTTMTVQWVGPAADAEQARLFVAPADGPDVWQQRAFTAKPFPLTDWFVYRCELTKLTPGTEYKFAVGTGATHRFRTMPAKATNDLTFVSGGDCGVNVHAANNNMLAAKQEPYFAIVGGDLGYDNGRSPKVALDFIRQYAKHMIDPRGRLIPLVVCVGNHEVNGGYNRARKDAPFFLALFDGFYNDATYGTLDFGNYLSLVLLDTGHVCPIAGEQTHWLETALRDRQEVPHLVAVNHVPAYPSYRLAEVAPGKAGTGDGNRKHWVPLFERYNVDFVLEHHDHTFKRTHPLIGGLKDAKRGILYLGDGSWGRIRSPNKAEHREYIDKVSEAYHLTLHRIEGDVRYHMAMEEGGRIIDICTTRKKSRSKTS